MSEKCINGKKISIRNRIINYLIILFMIHGFLYFLRPQEIYDLNSPIRYIKYLVLILTLIIILRESSFKKIFIYILVSTTLLVLNIIAVEQNFSFMSIVSYILPLSIFFFHEGLRKNLNIKTIVYWTYIVATFFGYFEFFIMGGVFYRFASSGYRVISIFVNPNNFALMLTLLSIVIISDRISKTKVFVLLINSLLLILLSGSKTGLFIFILVVSLRWIIDLLHLFVAKSKLKKNVLLYIPIIGISLICFTLIITLSNKFNLNVLLNQIRSIETMMISLESRFMQYSNFLSVSNLIFPWKENVNYTDNIYFHLWGTFGFPVVISYVFFNMYLLYKTIIKRSFTYFAIMFIFLISGFSTNIIYLWPLGYIYWYVAGSILSNKTNMRIYVEQRCLYD